MLIVKQRNTIAGRDLLRRDDTDPTLLYPAYNLSVPIDHWQNDSLYEPHSDGTFSLRYWFDATYYKPGGPVIVLQSGETSGTDRLPYLQKGILHELAVATNGIGVVLEHRYYGTSIPTTDFSTENLRFLTTDQALADQAYFSKNVVFAGLEDCNLTAPSTPHIAYGGSYAGAFVAFLRKAYPEVYWGMCHVAFYRTHSDHLTGAISSSGVIEAITDYWKYFEPIRVYGEPACISYSQKLTNALDNIIASKDNATIAELKGAWGLPNVTYNDDFMSVLASGLYTWQNRNWDPAVNDPSFDLYCGNLTSNSTIYPQSEGLTTTVHDLLEKGGYGSEISTLTTPFLNWIGWLAAYTVDSCQGPQDSCYSSHNYNSYQADDITQDWRAWPYQYCTEWGFLQTGSGVPATQLPLISRTITLEYCSIICVAAFNITSPPNTTAINKYGGFGLSYPRLAIIDGEQDPWRPATAHASPFNTTAHNRTDTISEPFILIDGAVHHWDENGLFPNETTGSLPPKPIESTHAKEVQFVQAWMSEWEHEKLVGPV